MSPERQQREVDYGDAHTDWDQVYPEPDDDEEQPAIDVLGPDALQRASWNLRRIAQLTARRDRIAKTFTDEIEMLQERMIEALNRINACVDRLEAPVIGLTQALFELDPKVKTYELPHGDLLITVPKAPRVTISDPGLLVSWAQEHDQRLIKATYKPVHEAVKAALLDGEIIPGASAEIPAPTFNYKARGIAA